MASLSDDALIKQVQPYTKSSPERIAGMIAAVRKIDQDGIPGAIVECGVWLGGNIVIARKLSPQRTCWLYDTFCGMPAPGEQDGPKAKHLYDRKASVGVPWAAASLEEVQGVLNESGVWDAARLRFVVGDVADTLRGADLPDCIALLRLDTDWYASTRVELDVLYPRLALGGVLIVDDYGHWAGARQAVDEYFGNIEMVKIDYTARMLIRC